MCKYLLKKNTSSSAVFLRSIPVGLLNFDPRIVTRTMSFCRENLAAFLFGVYAIRGQGLCGLI